MTLYQRRRLPSTDIGSPGPLPKDLIGLKDQSLADLGWTDPALGYRGFGFFPVPDPVVQPPAKVVRVSKIDFSRLLTLPERAALLGLRKQIAAMSPAEFADPVNTAFVQAAIMFESFDLPAEFIELTHPDTVAAVGTLMVALGVITSKRATEILAGQAPV